MTRRSAPPFLPSPAEAHTKSLSLSLGPEPEDAVKTKRKLTGGLEAATIQRPAKKVKEASPALGARKRVESKSDDFKPFVQ